VKTKSEYVIASDGWR